jgi:hypothetical protein
VPSNLTLETVRPNSTLTEVTATAHETEEGTASNWTVDAFAVCASRPAGLRRVTRSSAMGSDEFAQTTATCPAGTHLIGTGGEVVGGAGEVMLDDLRADSALTKTTVTGFEDHTGLDPDWRVTAYAICTTAEELTKRARAPRLAAAAARRADSRSNTRCG